MYRNNRFKKCPRNHSKSKVGYSSKEEFTHVFDLDDGESLKIDDKTLMTYLGKRMLRGEQAQFGFIAPDDVSILRLELFARRYQFYEQELVLDFGERLRINKDLDLRFLPSQGVYGKVQVSLDTKKRIKIQKSIFN